jgi:hypothetical protein
MELETVSAQDDNGSVRTVWPQPWARNAGVDHCTEVKPVIHVPTGALVTLPPGLSFERFLKSVDQLG